MKGSVRIALLYTAITVLATAANLVSQAGVVHAYSGPHAIECSIMIGTLVGMPIKYTLEKRLIFGFVARSLAHDGRLLVLYSSMGLITTAAFWTIEYLFHRIFLTNAMRYLGGALGLALGSFIKYHLDKRFVFVRPALGLQGQR